MNVGWRESNSDARAALPLFVKYAVVHVSSRLRGRHVQRIPPSIGASDQVRMAPR